MVETKGIMPNRTGRSITNGACMFPTAWPVIKQLPRLFCLVLVVVLLASPDQLQAASKFKSFKMETPDGATRTLDDFKNKATLIAFFFPTCTYCNQAFPETVRLYEKYKDQGLSMVWINIVEDEEDLIPEWQAKHQYDIPVLIGASQQYLARRYDIRMTPEHLIIDSDRKILFRQRGYHPGDEKALEENIIKALDLAP
jgi:peroxiredoxin